MRRSLVMGCLCASGSLIYLLPYLREYYYRPLQAALGLDHTQLGVMASAFGATAMVSYLPGGWLADRLPARKLIAGSLAATGAVGLYFATFPSYPVCVAVHAVWGVTSTLTFWGALIRATREWGAAPEQGRAFGLLECGRGASDIGVATLGLALFAWLGSGDRALSEVILLLSAGNLALGALVWVALGDGAPAAGATGPRLWVGRAEVGLVLRNPVVWAIAAVILAAYAAYSGTYYFTPYATDAFGASVAAGGAVGVARNWLRPGGALGAGLVADRVGVARTVAGCFAGVLAAYAVFAAAPGGAALGVVLAAGVVAGAGTFGLRGIYYALLEDGGVPRAVTGTATGVVSVIGYTPDIFVPLVAGATLDAHPGAAGYRYFFGFNALVCAVGLAAALYLVRRAAAAPRVGAGRTPEAAPV